MAVKRKNYEENTDFYASRRQNESTGNIFGATMDEYNRNNKLDDTGMDYDKTYDYNYNPKYTDKINSLRKQKENFGNFSYDPYNDEAYRALTDVYTRNAEKASANALARAAAANGGRVSSGVGTATALAYNDKMSQLEAEIPALREAAYQKYTDEYNRLNNSYNDYLNAEANNYSMWSDRYDRLYKGLRDIATDDYNNSYLDVMRNKTDADIESMKYNDALTASEFMGQATNDFAQMAGVNPNEMSASEKNKFLERQIEIGSKIGRFPADVLRSYGINVDGIVDGNNFVNTVDRDDAQLNFLLSSKNRDSGGAGYDWIREFYGDDAVPYTQNGNAPNMYTDAHGTYFLNENDEKVYIASPSGEAPYDEPKTETSGSNGIGGGSGSGSGSGSGASPKEQIENQRTDQAKALKAEELYNSGQISFKEFEKYLQ